MGVVSDMPYRNRRDPVPATLYRSAFQQSAWGGYHIFLRTDGPVGQLKGQLRATVAEINPDIPVPQIRTQTEIIAQTGAKERVFTQLLTIFGCFALLITGIGVHGVTFYAVTRRTSEVGVRVAVGATPGQILWLVLRQVVVLAGMGLVVGVPAALAAAAIVMLAVAVGAGLVPALLAARLSSLNVLRSE